ncbi:LuxR C-terminal-related transcriptional regulator [Amycolatopsis decaplanina]|uniref:LuxR family transcriptional regulator n=1 Tax=Amycolatopsis decaplanina DSM 44594 TaxID=1284240 RepID=M2YK20_9PSEU|nr:LuxR C-terminal-related transcriptional regulator [Amycolatopsis decaplanina]EME62115.1 LuxR family transcriptional regulator [Amycolatopsis decaplanina DSM 44594]
MAGIRTISPIGKSAFDAGRTARPGIISEFVEVADMPLAALSAGLRLGSGNAAFFRLLGRRPADVLGESFPELVTTGPDHLRDRLNRVAEGWEQRFRGSVTGLGSDGAERLTIVAGRMRAPGTAILLTMLPETGPTVARAEQLSSVTDIEAKILQGIASGLSSLEMADKYYLSRQGIDYHVARLQRKFKARNRVELVSRAFATGLLDSTAWPPRVPESRRAS